MEIWPDQITDLAVNAIDCADNSGLATGRDCREVRSAFYNTIPHFSKVV